MVEEGYIKIFRKIMDWKWWSDAVMVKVFLWMLLNANWKDGTFNGETIPRGSFVTSRRTMNKELNISEQQARTILNRLKSTHEITTRTTSKYTVITLNNYEMYQGINQVINQQITNNQPTDNQQITTIEEYKNIKQGEGKEEYMSTLEPTPKPKGKKKASVTVDELVPMVNEKNYSNELKEMLTTWLKYRVEIKDPVKSPTSFSRTLSRVDKAVAKHGEKALIDLIDYGIGKEWHGIIFERLEEGGANNDRRGDGEKAGGTGSADRSEPEYGTVEYYKSIGWKA